MMDCTVSAILTTYQRPELAKRALESILKQSWSPAEIIVVEDGGEPTMLAEWISGLNRSEVTYVRHETNRGLAAARNTGLQRSRCELIAYLDDDDQWLPARLEEQIRHFLSIRDKENLAALQVGCKVMNDDGWEIGLVLPVNRGRLRESIMRNGAVTPSSSFLFVRSALLQVGGFDENLTSGIDHDIWMKLAVAGFSSEPIAKPLVTVVKDDRHSMMSDTQHRLKGINQYVAKWTPTYKEWFGERRGEEYARRYLIRVACRLAAEKLVSCSFRSSWVAIRAVLTHVNGHWKLWIFAAYWLARGCSTQSLLRSRRLWRHFSDPKARVRKEGSVARES